MSTPDWHWPTFTPWAGREEPLTLAEVWNPNIDFETAADVQEILDRGAFTALREFNERVPKYR